MRFLSPPTSWPTRGLAVALAALLAVAPVYGQSPTGAAGSSDPASNTTATKARRLTSPAKSTAKGRKAAGRTRTGRAGTARIRTAKGRTARRGRAAKIKLAFVASTELRPMAQQLATLRTPAAYTGVAKYAHQHDGEAAAAAYLALG